MAAGDEQAMNRYAGVQARFEAVGGYGWRERARSVVHGLGFVDDDLDRALRTFSGGQLTRASLARALAAQPDLLLLDEPTNHLDIESLEWLEQTLLDLDAAIVLVAHDRWFLETVGTSVLELEAGRARFFNGHLARVAQGAGRPRAGARARDREAAGRDRAHGALRRALPLQGDQGAPGPGSPEEAQQDRTHRARPARRPRAGVRLQEARALGARDLRARGRAPAGRRRSAARAARRRGAVARARRARLARRAQRHGQDDPHPGARRRARARRRPAALAATTSRSATSASTPRSSRAAMPARRSRLPSSAPGCRPTRPVRCSGASCSAARRPRSRWTGSAAVSAGGCRWPSSSSRAPTC